MRDRVRIADAASSSARGGTGSRCRSARPTWETAQASATMRAHDKHEKLRASAAWKDASEVMRVLVSNDDGVDAPGIAVLAQTLSAAGEVIIVAPDRDRSGASNSLTLDQPIRVTKLAENRYRVAGTPTARFTHPSEVARVVLLLASETAGNITGTDVLIDGGMVTTV